ncbi:MAG: L,D-transpeptidase [Anaerolineae bacterium]|nr:L,D-transpeptidase [Anaerolineae bacterium]
MAKGNQPSASLTVITAASLLTILAAGAVWTFSWETLASITATSAGPSAATAPSSSTPTPIPTATTKLSPIPTWTPTFTPQPTRPHTPPPTTAPRIDSPVAPTAAPPSEFYYGRWIDVNLTHQTLTAYQGDQVARTTLVSTGLERTPTPVGVFHIQTKLRYDDMSGPGYYLPDVPYVMYFYKGYGIHGTYWHANFGHSMSHGCINLPTTEAKWLYYWVAVGTPVNIHE